MYVGGSEDGPFYVQVFVPLGDMAVVVPREVAAGWATGRLERRLDKVKSAWTPWGWLKANLLCMPSSSSLPSLCPTGGTQDTALQGPDGGCLETCPSIAGNM